MSTNKQSLSFGDYAVEYRLQGVDSFLNEIGQLINFKKLESILKKNKIRKVNACGVKSYDSLIMFKILLIQKFYNLSDKAVEETLYVNLLYIRFSGLSLESSVPDDTTICRFRNSLIKNRLLDKLFDNVNKQLADKGCLALSGNDILIDATLIKSDNDKIKNKIKSVIKEDKIIVDEKNEELDLLIGQELIKIKPSIKEVKKLLNKKEYNSKTFKNQELDKLQNIDTKDIKTSFGIIENNEDSYNAKDKIDKEIRIGYQAGKKQYAAGYKGHIVTDVESGAILKPIMTFANTSDISAVNKLIENMDNIKSFGGDKAYKSKEIDELLKSKNIKNDICFKETKKMSKEERTELRENEKPKHKIRAKVEHTFALIKSSMKQEKTRFIGLVRNSANFTLICIAANLKLFAHKQMRARKVNI
jgi:IS5 family transposase